MFAVGDPEEGLPEPVFYTDGRRASTLDAPSFPRRLVYIAGPLWERATSPTEARRALDPASLAWNGTRLPEPERTAMLGQVVAAIAAGSVDLGTLDPFSEMVKRALRWPGEQLLVIEIRFEEQRPGEWHVAAVTLTPAEVSPRTSSRAAKPRAPRRGSRP